MVEYNRERERERERERIEKMKIEMHHMTSFSDLH
jgi:hypothetical protein